MGCFVSKNVFHEPIIMEPGSTVTIHGGCKNEFKKGFKLKQNPSYVETREEVLRKHEKYDTFGY